MKSIFDPNFRYVHSSHTDIRKTFARIRREMEKEKEKEQGKLTAVPLTVVTPIQNGRKKNGS